VVSAQPHAGGKAGLPPDISSSAARRRGGGLARAGVEPIVGHVIEPMLYGHSTRATGRDRTMGSPLVSSLGRQRA
jgi:hypothetical protein